MVLLVNFEKCFRNVSWHFYYCIKVWKKIKIYLLNQVLYFDVLRFKRERQSTINKTKKWIKELDLLVENDRLVK